MNLTALKYFYQPQVPATGSLRRKGPETLQLSEVDDTLMLNDSQVSTFHSYKIMLFVI